MNFVVDTFKRAAIVFSRVLMGQLVCLTEEEVVEIKTKKNTSRACTYDKRSREVYTTRMSRVDRTINAQYGAWLCKAC